VGRRLRKMCSGVMEELKMAIESSVTKTAKRETLNVNCKQNTSCTVQEDGQTESRSADGEDSWTL
jgi:hypothetical protein